MAPLLPRRSPRSDDLERGEPGPPLHPITGTFADATHAKDFAARCFRSAFPLHALLLAAFLVGDTYYYVLLSTAPSITNIAIPLVYSTMLLLRIGLHRSSDHSRAQQLGSAAWALFVVAYTLGGVVDPSMYLEPVTGASADLISYTAVAGFGVALVNSSHGLSFAHKTTLALLLLFTPPLVQLLQAAAHFFRPVAAVTRASDGAMLSTTVYCSSIAASHVCAHVMELLAARQYLTHEQLQESYQRLHYDLQNPARPPDDRRRVARGLLATRHPGARDDAPSAPAASGPASTSTSSSSRRVSFAAPDPQAAAPPSNGAAVAGPSQGAGAAPALLHEAAPAAAGPSTTDPSEAEGPARSDSLPTLPPGPPSSASIGSLARSGVGPEWHAETQRHAEAVAEPTAKTYPTWAELDAQFYAEQRAAESAAMLPAANSSAAGAASSSVGRPPIPPPSWAELAYRRFYAERAARAPAESGGAPPMGQPPTWAELEALRAAGLAADEQGAVQGGSAAEQEEDVVAAARALTDLGQPQRRGGR